MSILALKRTFLDENKINIYNQLQMPEYILCILGLHNFEIDEISSLIEVSNYHFFCLPTDREVTLESLEEVRSGQLWEQLGITEFLLRNYESKKFLTATSPPESNFESKGNCTCVLSIV